LYVIFPLAGSYHYLNLYLKGFNSPGLSSLFGGFCEKPPISFRKIFFKYPIKLKVLSVISIFSLLKSKPAGNYIKSKGNFKIGKKYQQPNKKPKENKSAATQENVRKW